MIPIPVLGKRWRVLDLFKRRVGAWFEPRLGYMWQENTGVTPTTSGGQTIGLLLDQSQGAVLGPELVTTPYSGSTSGTWAISSTSITRNSSATGQASLSLSISVDTTKLYLVSFTVANLSGDTFFYRIGGGTAYQITSNGVYTARVLGGSTASSIIFAPWAGSAGEATITNISVRQILGNHASQATAANRPIYGVRRNLLTYSEDMSKSVWNTRLTDATLTHGVADPFGGTKATTLTATAPVGRTSYDSLTLTEGTSVTVSVWLRRRTGTGAILVYNCAGVSTTTNTTITATWTRYSVTSTVSATGLRYPGIACTSSGDAVDIYGWQVESASTATDYQRVTTATDYDAGRFPAIRHADSTDVLIAAMPAINVRRNLLTYSEQFDNATWNSQLATATLAGVTSTGRAYYSLIVTAGSAIGNKQQPISKASSVLTYTCSVCAKAGTFSYLQIAVFSGGNGVRAWFNLTAGAKGTSGSYGSGFTSSDYTIVPDVDGFFRCTLIFQSDATSGLTVYINANSANGLTGPTSSGSDNIFIRDAQLELGSVATDYQKITDWTSEQYSSAGSVYFGVPQGMSALHNQSIGTNYTLPAVNSEIYGWVVVPERLTRPEEAQLERYFLKRAGISGGPDYLLDNNDQQLTDDSDELLLRA